MGALLSLQVLAELVNIGTLVAFVIVRAAVLVMRRIDPSMPRPFRCPLVPLIPILGIAFCLLLMFSYRSITGCVLYFGWPADLTPPCWRPHGIFELLSIPFAIDTGN
jgi:amino acid transporter